jgi:predicted negative regulator of RcsB-dependent stress response
MAVYDLEEQEQLDELKTWWKQYGNLVTWLLLAAAVVAVGWQGWNWYQRNQSAQASSVYMALQQGVAQGDANRVKTLAGDLIGKYPGSTYAAMGVLMSARMQVESGDAKTARAQLSWAVDNVDDPGLRDLARLRLAIILIDEKAYDEASRQLAKEPSAPFAARFGELRGDLFAAQGKASEARAAYETAIRQSETSQKASGTEQAPAGNNYRDMLHAKLEHLGSAK